MKYRREIEVTGDVGAVFAYLADFSRAAEWDPGVESARRLDDPPTRVGSRFELIAPFRGRKLRFEYVVLEYEADRRVVLHGEGDKAVSDDTIAVRAASPGRTTVAYEADIRLKGARRVAEPLLRPIFARMGDKALAGLKAKLG